jgi:hypothetical protein
MLAGPEHGRTIPLAGVKLILLRFCHGFHILYLLRFSTHIDDFLFARIDSSRRLPVTTIPKALSRRRFIYSVVGLGALRLDADALAQNICRLNPGEPAVRLLKDGRLVRLLERYEF